MPSSKPSHTGPDPVARIVQQAAQFHTAGRFAEAEPLYRQALARSPANFDAVHLYGVLLSQTKRFEQAETFLRRALQIQPNSAVALSNLGNLLRDQGRPEEALPHLRRAVSLDPKLPAGQQNLGVVLNALEQGVEAEECFRRALTLQPDYPEALNSLGGVLRKAEKLEESAKCYRRALALRPNYAEAYTGLGATLHLQNKSDEALACCRRAVELRPDYPEGHNNLAMAFTALKKYEDAESEVRLALRLKPGYFDARSNLGSVLESLRRHEEAALEYRKAIQLKPKSSSGWMNLGSALRNLRRFDDAKDACRRAIELSPDSPMERYNLGVVHLDLCEIEQAIASFREAVALKPEMPLPHWGLALALLANGDLEQGWKEYEWRWDCTQFHPTRPSFTQPPWDGSALDGKTILLYCEQGMGDAIQFVRYASLLAERGARVIVQCQPSMRRLFATVPGVIATHSPPELLPEFDVHFPLLSLPRMIGTTLQNVPASVPYLFADAEKVEAWKQKLPPTAGRLKVGLVWAGNPEHQRDHDRSISLATLAPLADAGEVTFVSLQKGAAALQSPAPPAGMQLLDYTADLADFADTAGLIANLDLVISVDTSVAHLAAAMGKTVWTLLPFAPDWRWLLGRSDSPWYPTMRLFRQPSPGDWGSPIRALAEDLRAFNPKNSGLTTEIQRTQRNQEN
jgi:tetratricopeptide (TPR) repeat protein